MVRPIEKYSAGAIQASIFVNERKVKGKTVEIPSIMLQKRYLLDGNWKATSSFNPSDLPKAMLVLLKAYDYVMDYYQNEKDEEEAVK